jgi:hypothetical protein
MIQTYKSQQGLSILEILIAVSIVSFVFIPAVQIVYSIHPQSIQDIVNGSTSQDSKTSGISNTRSQFYERGDLKVDFGKGGIWKPNTLSGINFSRQMCIDFSLKPISSSVSQTAATSTSASTSASIPISTNLDPRLYVYSKEEMGISTSTVLTGIARVGQRLYISANSSSTTEPDIFVYDVVADPAAPDMTSASILTKPTLRLIQSKNIGPGSSAIQSKGMYVISSNTGVKNQVDILDNNLATTTQIIIPGSNSNTSPLTKVTLYAGDTLIVGTEKSVLPEITLFNIHTGQVLYSIETGYGLNDMILFDNKLIVAGPRDPEIEVFDIYNFGLNGNFGKKIGQYDLPGGSGNAKVLSQFGDLLFVARTKGGNEFVTLVMDTASDTINFKEVLNKKIGWSIDSMMNFDQYILLSTADDYKEFQLYEISDSDSNSNSNSDSNPKFDPNAQVILKSVVDLPVRVTSSTCFQNTVWATLRESDSPTLDSSALALIVFN